MRLVIESIVQCIVSVGVLWFNVFSECLRLVMRRKAGIVRTQHVIVITGCDSGFGEMSAVKLNAMGFHVVACCLTEKGALAIRDKVSLSVVCNVTKEEDIKETVEATTVYCTKNNARLWGVLNNAGIADGGALDWTSMDTYRFVFEVNTFGVIAVTKAFLPLLKRNPGARVVNLCSLAGLMSAPCMTAYNASKHAVEGFAKGLRAELRPWDIYVCNINPGFFNTPILASGTSAMQRGFDASPIEVRSQYDWEQVQSCNHLIDGVKEDPRLVVAEIVDAMTDAAPAMWYFPGYQSLFMRCMVNINGAGFDIMNSLVAVPAPPQPQPEALSRFRSGNGGK